MATSQDWVTWTCGPHLDPRYLLWALRAMRSEIIGRMQGSTHKTIYMPDVEQLAIPLLPIDQQVAVARYIDEEAKQINQVTHGKNELLERLNERIDSKVLSLIGSSDLVAPRGTPSLPLKRMLRRRLADASDEDGMITAYRDGVVTARSNRRPEGYTEAEARTGLRRVEVGDVPLHPRAHLPDLRRILDHAHRRDVRVVGDDSIGRVEDRAIGESGMRGHPVRGSHEIGLVGLEGRAGGNV